ncbi:Sel1 domain-containing protein [Melioribacter roseus P3M-2]|uniref:Sel1 domain-containing protein n=1 Tax=Melioribacter roseus (strain DSM 23840 / JCM 17771 / VKM B-2668 / P3M-2) TaxID=1191523 RepID=I7A1K3_MELRP|nr:tetratricopeptide repeat protein [Melioribacter roseus]AFN73871.1 Sel1 domain-containing protein [Melioribacter roseus P3M-2]
MIKYTFLIALLFSMLLPAQKDTLKSEAFKNSRPKKVSYFQAKYPSYSLLAGYILVNEANRGDPFAQHELGIRYLIGKGFEPDTVKAIYWIRKAADQNLAAAKYNYGILLYNGIGVPWNPFESFYNFKSAAELGMPEAQFALGIMYTDNLVVSRDYSKAYAYIRKAAKAEYEPAKELEEEFRSKGLAPAVDSSIAAEQQKTVEPAPVINTDWDVDYISLENDARVTDEERISNLLKKNKYELRDYLGINAPADSLKDTTAYGMIKYAAENGSPEALLLIAASYEQGLWHKKDLIQAGINYLNAYRFGSYKAGERLFRLIQSESLLESLKNKIKAGDSHAYYFMAGIRALEMTNIITLKDAVDYLNKAAGKNYVPALIELGLLYSTGAVAQKDINKALAFWKTAQKLGSVEAEIRIAFTTLVDSALTTYENNSFEILKKYSDEGSVLAQTYLAYCYEKGISVKEDKATAVKLYRMAARRGNETAYNALKRMYDELRPPDDTFLIYSER